MLGFVEILKSYRERGEIEVKRDIKRQVEETVFKNISPVNTNILR